MRRHCLQPLDLERIAGLALAGNFNCVADSNSLTIVGVLPDPLAKSLVIAVLQVRHGNGQQRKLFDCNSAA